MTDTELRRTALELWTNALSIYRAEVGNTRQTAAARAAVDYIADKLRAVLKRELLTQPGAAQKE